MTQRTRLVRWLVVRGRRLVQARQWHAALRCWEQLLRFGEPGSPLWRQAQCYLARIAERLGDFARARSHLRQLLRCQPHEARWYYWLGRLYRRQQSAAHQRAALRHLRRAVFLAPQQASYWSALGRCLADVGRPRGALRCLYRAWHLQPCSSRNLLWLVELLLACDRFDEAQRVVAQARFLHRGDVSWQLVCERVGFALLQRQQQTRARGSPAPILLPFPPAVRATHPDADSRTSPAINPTVPKPGLGQDDTPPIIRMEPGHPMSRHRLRLHRRW
ncbi:Lipopolysaccharide assembly protein B [bacterium HR36]|nr:Lipopolysaccharide assembly protein B [bacterium HR36]